MIIIKGIGSYRDGGTIGIQCSLISVAPNIRLKDVEICLNQRMGGGDSKLYMGYPQNDGSNLIEDQVLIDEILRGLESHKKMTNHYVDKVLKAYET